MERRIIMNIADYDYNLPEDLIAQSPLAKRDEARLLVVDKNDGHYEDHVFKDIIKYLKKGDALVLNNTKVIPARLIGTKAETKATIELLLLKNLQSDIWECLSKPTKRLKVGTFITFGQDKLQAEILKILDDGIVQVKFNYEGIFLNVLDELGQMPLPPYIHGTLQDQSYYQTVYAKNIGSAAAPTAGLHFTESLLEQIEKKGINIVYITLHVGLGTFRPVMENDITKHVMHSEYYEMDDKSAETLNLTKQNHKKIIAVGTTSVRTLETIYGKYNSFVPCTGNTNIFIYPGYHYQAVDSLVTNFHLPKSTLVMLVSAFASKNIILDSYKYAISQKYRFFSFGDAMFLTDLNQNKK